ncbi:MAG: hypothetical protein N0C88_08565 [Candidatus Thiodiazotropha lotti]|uniref:Uncharacterized protein n=1 Tax=Candidatus Thiodiazotropha lotti TaxID=2792787 RepID=A0A9E4K4J0_9GAMM|nr:hypothetical protein [Candidatus Thiodiazotropha lotti]MCW4203361.1 hypothetical protein [Candidatus Thiodiazotropha lotti]
MRLLAQTLCNKENKHMWQCFLEIIDLVAKVAQTAIAAFVAWLAWRTFLKEEEQDTTVVEDVEKPLGEVTDLKLFETSKQTTWLKKTTNGIECHIDEHRKGKVGGHKWTLSPSQIKTILETGDIYVNPGYKIRTGLVSIGNRTNWLYSKKLFPEPANLHHKVIELLKAANA